ncbi:MAG TPA: isoleucine--tRNA ligase [Bacteroidota bacterium]|nr:isoleucine--tRNA ligase [Bacteroidota bacterium]
MKFKELTDRLSYPALEKEILDFWKREGIFGRSIAEREGRPGFTFYEGPPTANGRPGIHHVMARTLKDLVCRYRTMTGFQVHRKAGWDTHGLPVEIEVEKQLGFRHKDDIVRYGVAEFNRKCQESVWKYKADWERMTEQMGYWVDLTDPYITLANNYIESVWWALKQYFDRGMIYRGYKIQPYCPRCETPLSSHEVSLGYDDVKDPSVYVRMRLRAAPDTSFLVWTTTPWTLIANVALAVAPGVTYVKVQHGNEKLILAEARLGVLEGEYTVLEKFPGSALRGMEYERIFNYHPVTGKAFCVVEADFVTTEDGTGIVHMAPAYGEDDYQTSRKEGLPTIHPVNSRGEFGPDVPDFAGKFVKEADHDIIRVLKERGILYRKETITHSYPHCWRCKTPLLYYARDSWYISTTKYAARMIELNRQITWVPPEVGEGRFGNWLEENKDWALSRDRFWGTPLPVWVCEKCAAQKCVGSVAEYRTGNGVREPLDLHKPFVDEVTFDCSCGGTMRRTPELIDVWFDSGAMPFAQWHYPFEHRELIDSGSRYPADFISEGIDQTRGWFYSLHAIGTFLFDRPAYNAVMVNELILDAEGQKMSKSRGNTVDPFAVLEKYGADATRWYLVTASPPWRPTSFDQEGLADTQRKFFGTLVNTYAFFAMYANIDRFSYREDRIPLPQRAEIDRWVISELHSLVARYRTAMDAYDVTKAARGVSEFTIDQLSNWYVRRNRRRFWKSEMGKDKLAAYQTLYECLDTVVRLMAPFAPFLADELYRDLNAVTGRGGTASVHLAMIPEPDAREIDRGLEERMERAERIVMLVRAMRMKSNLKVRQPLARIILPIAGEREREEVRAMEDVIRDEINVKAVEYVSDTSGIVTRRAKANFKSIGPKFGKSVQQVAQRIRELKEDQIAALEREGTLALPVDGAAVTIAREDIEIIRDDIRGWLVESDGSLTVALDTQITPELLAEGLAREFVNRVQNMRKDAGFALTDRIAITFRSGKQTAEVLTAMSPYITGETLADELSAEFRDGEHTATFDLNGEEVTASIARRGHR